MFYKIVLLLSLLMLTANISCAGEKENIQGIVEKFLKHEMDGYEYVRNDENMVNFSKDAKQILNKNPSGAGLFLNIQPLRIVTEFNVKMIRINNKNASVDVAFLQIGKTNGVGLYDRKIIPEYTEDIVTYNLVKTRRGWRLYDPPEPRISKEAITRFYTERINRFKKIVDSGFAVEDQKRQYYKDVESLSVIQHLNNGKP